MDNLGQITITLSDYFTFPDDFEKLFNEDDSDLNSIFKISLKANEFPNSNFTIEIKSYSPSKITEIKIRKNIGERSMKELLGSSFDEFMDSDRYETTILRNLHVLAF